MDAKNTLTSQLKVSVLIIFIANLTTILNYLVQIYLSRQMTIEEFGVFNSVNSLGLILSSFTMLTPLIWIFLRDYQKDRILTFIDPARDPLGKSYNAIQSIIAVGSGEIFGRGLGQGTQSNLSFLPERHTDFIFATISEQLGFIGSSLIIFSWASGV